MTTRLIEELEQFEALGGDVISKDIPANAVIPEWACENLQDISPKRKAKRDAVINGFYCCLADGGNEDLFTAVRALAVSMLSRITKSFGDAGACGNHDDMAQDVCLKVLEGFDAFEGDGEKFLRWVMRIIKNKRVDAAIQRKKEREIEVPFHVERTDEDGKVTEIENPALHENPYHNNMVRIPESIQGEDLQICRWLLAGMSYAEITNETGLTERAIEGRMYRTRERESAKLAIQRAERKKNDAPEKERQTYRTRMNQEYVAKIMARVNVPEYDGPKWEVPEREPDREPANVAAGVTTVPAGEEGEQ